jgi:murein DD-endopeptidase MepM/ murein hydrolase activator NlpD
VGELQASLARLNGIGERVARKAGLPAPEAATPGRGGPYEPLGGKSLSGQELARLLDSLGAELAGETDRLLLLESELLSRQVRQGHLPMDRPVEESGYLSSTFGVRVDPFTGRLARHNGLDYADAAGAAILAAESGVVLRVESHAQFGHMLDIDHGNGLITRYGHTQLVLVKKGDVVRRGQKIAEVGSSGRSTGPHLHFEVLRNGVPQNPVQFLSARS